MHKYKHTSTSNIWINNGTFSHKYTYTNSQHVECMKVYERERESCGSVMADPPHIRSLFYSAGPRSTLPTHIRSQPLLCKATPNPTHSTWKVTFFTFLFSLSLLLFHPRSTPHKKSPFLLFVTLRGLTLPLRAHPRHTIQTHSPCALQIMFFPSAYYAVHPDILCIQ